jgi:hypothetical protein
MKLFRRSVALVLAVSLASTGWVQTAQATTISTEQVAAAALQAQGVTANHGKLLAALDRADLAAALQARGVSVGEMRARVGALTDAEAAELMAQIDAAPAGGDVLGLLFTVFIVLLVTDILGFTKVFPFTRSIR